MRSTRFRAAGLLAGGAIVGAVLAGAIAANAASPSPSPSPSSSSSTGTAAPDTDKGRGPGGGHAGETALTGSDLEKAKAAALKAVPGGTIVRVETDSGDAAYEAHMKKSDGTEVTVKFDKSFNVTGVEDGMGK